MDQLIPVTMQQLTNAFYIQSPRLQSDRTTGYDRPFRAFTTHMFWTAALASIDATRMLKLDSL